VPNHLPLDGVLFDFGGTLFDHDPEPTLLVREAARLGVELLPSDAGALWADIEAAAMHPDEVARGRDLDARVWAERWRALYGAADRVVAGLGAALDRVMLDPATWLPFEGALDVLRSLHERRVRIGVVSNTGWDIRTALRFHGVDELLTATVLSFEAGVVKPDPAIFELACARLGSEPARTLMVGDNPAADGGATRAGLPVWLVPPAGRAGRDNGLRRLLGLFDSLA
jgi:HAD superfamily hydrolase (TIGR01509 family)